MPLYGLSLALSKLPPGEHVSIRGTTSCGKTSLLFQHALTTAENGGSVLFISPSPLEQLPLPSKHAPQPSPHLLKKIQFKYPPTLADLLGIFDSVHIAMAAAGEQYDCVIVDGFHQFFVPLQTKGHDLTSEVAGACAHIIDAVKYISEHQSLSAVQPRPCTSLISMTHPFQAKFKVHTLGWEGLKLIQYTNYTVKNLLESNNLFFSCMRKSWKSYIGTTAIKHEIVRRWFPTNLQITSCGENHFTVSTSGDRQAPLFSYTLSQSHIDYFTAV